MHLASAIQLTASLVVAAALALALAWLALSPRLAARVGRWRWPLVAGGAAALAAVLVVFVGVTTARHELQIVLAEGLHTQVADPERLLQATEAAIEVALGDEFLAHAARRLGLDPPPPGLVREHAALRPIRRGERDPEGRLVPRPRAAATALALEYSATAPAPLVELAPGEHAAAHALVERVAHGLDALVLVELARRARSDEERLEALGLLRASPTEFAGWVERELAGLAEGASPAVAAALADTRARLAGAAQP